MEELKEITEEELEQLKNNHGYGETNETSADTLEGTGITDEDINQMKNIELDIRLMHPELSDEEVDEEIQKTLDLSNKKESGE